MSQLNHNPHTGYQATFPIHMANNLVHWKRTQLTDNLLLKALESNFRVNCLASPVAHLHNIQYTPRHFYFLASNGRLIIANTLWKSHTRRCSGISQKPLSATCRKKKTWYGLALDVVSCRLSVVAWHLWHRYDTIRRPKTVAKRDKLNAKRQMLKSM